MTGTSILLAVLAWGMIGMAVLAVIAAGVAWLRRRVVGRAGRTGAAPSKRAWHIETVDPIARLRSPYKPAPMCRRCLEMGRPGEPPMFMCRQDERCGLLEEEQADQP